MRIVIVALQRLTANGICAETIVSELIKRKHEVIWVCNYEAQLPRSTIGVEYIQVQPRLVDAWLARFEKNAAATRAVVALNRLGMLRAFFSWPLISRRYAARVVKAVLEAAANADMVIGVYTQIDALIAAHEAKLKYPRIHYVAWYLDSLSGGSGLRFMTHASIEKRGKGWNRKLLDNADAAVVMESSRYFHMTHNANEPYYSKIFFLDLPLLVLRNKSVFVDSSDSVGVGGGVKTIVYTGSIPQGIRSPKFFLEVLGRISDKQIRVVFVGEEKCIELKELAAADERIEIRGRVPHDAIASLLSSADFLLTLGNRLENMIPSKIFEYMAEGKPIIATCPTGDDPSIPYLERYGDVLLLKEWGDPDEAAAQLASFLSVAHSPITPGVLETTFWNNTPMAFCNFIETLGESNES